MDPILKPLDPKKKKRLEEILGPELLESFLEETDRMFDYATKAGWAYKSTSQPQDPYTAIAAQLMVAPGPDPFQQAVQNYGRQGRPAEVAAGFASKDWAESELDHQAEVTERDNPAADALWKANAPMEFRGLLDAQPSGKK